MAGQRAMPCQTWKLETPKEPRAKSQERLFAIAPAKPGLSAVLGTRKQAGRVGQGRPLLRCAPSSGYRIPRILSPWSGLSFRTGEAFQTLVFKEPLLCLQALFAPSSSFPLWPCPLKRKGDGGGSLLPTPSKKHNKIPVRTSRVCPCQTAGGFVLGSCFLTI